MPALLPDSRRIQALGLALGLFTSCGRDLEVPDPFPEQGEEARPRGAVVNTSSGLEGLIWGSLRDPTPGTQFQTLSLKEFQENASDLLILASACVGGRLTGESDCLLAVQKNGNSPYLFSSRFVSASSLDELASRVRDADTRGDAIRAVVGDEKNGFTLVAQAPQFGARAPRFESEWVRATSKKALLKKLAERAREGWLLSTVLKISGREDYGAVISKSADSGNEAYELQSIETTTAVDGAVKKLGAQGFVVRGVTRSKPNPSEPASALMIAYRLTSASAIRTSVFSADYRAGSREEWTIAEHASIRGKIMVSALDLDRCVIAQDDVLECQARAMGYRY